MIVDGNSQKEIKSVTSPFTLSTTKEYTTPFLVKKQCLNSSNENITCSLNLFKNAVSILWTASQSLSSIGRSPWVTTCAGNLYNFLSRGFVILRFIELNPTSTNFSGFKDLCQ